MNGWQRLWVVATVLWVLFYGALLAGGEIDSDKMLLFLAFVFLPPIGLYLLGLAMAWMIRGFRGK